MNIIDKFKSSIITIAFFGFIFFTSGLVINFLQLCSCIIWPFNKQLYRKINCYLALGLWSQFSFMAQWWSNSDCVVYFTPGDEERIVREHSIILMNHKYDIDWLAGWIMCQRLGIMQGSKIVAKQSVGLIPILGWCWRFTESIFLRREWESDKKTLFKYIRRVLDDYPENYFFNFLFFCEGTRFTEKKHIVSMKYAKEKGLPELKHHLLPRTKGLTLLLQASENRIAAMYDITVGFKKSGAPPSILSIIKGQSCQAEIFARRFPCSEISRDYDECDKWINKLYQEKDQIFDHFAQHDTFDGLGLVRKRFPRNYLDLIIELVLITTIGLPSFYFLMKFLWASSLIIKIIFLLVIGLVTILARRMINITQTEYGSEYGTTEKRE